MLFWTLPQVSDGTARDRSQMPRAYCMQKSYKLVKICIAHKTDWLLHNFWESGCPGFYQFTRKHSLVYDVVGCYNQYIQVSKLHLILPMNSDGFSSCLSLATSYFHFWISECQETIFIIKRFKQAFILVCKCITYLLLTKRPLPYCTMGHC